MWKIEGAWRNKPNKETMPCIEHKQHLTQWTAWMDFVYNHPLRFKLISHKGTSFYHTKVHPFKIKKDIDRWILEKQNIPPHECHIMLLRWQHGPLDQVIYILQSPPCHISITWDLRYTNIKILGLQKLHEHLPMWSNNWKIPIGNLHLNFIILLALEIVEYKLL